VIEVKFPDWVYQAKPPGKTSDPVGAAGTVGASLVEPGTESRAPSPDQAIGSLRVFTMAELAQLTSWQLDVLRNEIYARHGRTFNRADLREYFEHQPWYKPVYPPDGFPEGILTPTERFNANLIAEYQRTH
jgi:serine/threonine-protein kinase